MVLSKLHIDDGKESWAAGDSEINVKGYTTFINGYDSAVGRTEAYRVRNADYESRIFDWPRNFTCASGGGCSRGDFFVRVDYAIHGDWYPQRPYPTEGRGDYFAYTIYEYDSWPTGTKVSILNVGNFTLETEYRSADDHYWKIVMPYSQATHVIWNAAGTEFWFHLND